MPGLMFMVNPTQHDDGDDDDERGTRNMPNILWLYLGASGTLASPRRSLTGYEQLRTLNDYHPTPDAEKCTCPASNILCCSLELSWHPRSIQTLLLRSTPHDSSILRNLFSHLIDERSTSLHHLKHVLFCRSAVIIRFIVQTPPPTA